MVEPPFRLFWTLFLTMFAFLTQCQFACILIHPVIIAFGSLRCVGSISVVCPREHEEDLTTLRSMLRRSNLNFDKCLSCRSGFFFENRVLFVRPQIEESGHTAVTSFFSTKSYSFRKVGISDTTVMSVLPAMPEAFCLSLCALSRSLLI